MKKPSTLNVEYFKELLIDGTYQNRIDAISALHNCEHKEIEDILLEEFKTADQHTKCMICANLRTTGTEKSIEFLNLELKRARSKDLKYFIEDAIKHITDKKNSSSQH